MIYLIEDRKSRRLDYGWTDEHLASYNQAITLIDNANSLIENRNKILSDGNVILMHLSFEKAEDGKFAVEIESFKIALKGTTLLHAYFSGGISTRTLDGNTCELPPSALYTNLKVFIEHAVSNDIDFRYLLFGDNYHIEEKLRDITSKAVNDFEGYRKTDKNTIIFGAIDSDFQMPDPFENMTSVDVNHTTDKDLQTLINQNLFEKNFDAIYVHLCMSNTLSDYIGLRFAMLIRFADTPNRHTPVFIVGEADIANMLSNECVDILKMPGVKYVSMSDALYNNVNNAHVISDSEYKLGVKNIHLNIPTSIGDPHSVANLWAMKRWSDTLEDSNSQLDGLKQDIGSTLYFNYLSAMYPAEEAKKIASSRLVISEDDNYPMNILLVDDEADKGWYELISHIIAGKNKIRIDHIGDEILSKTENELEVAVLEKIKRDNVNVVILDFRLHKSDFDTQDIRKITGYKLLQSIKKYNRGIQVLIFSATNKVWNWDALQKADADGFVMKESPANSVDPQFTINSIRNFAELLNKCAQNTYKVSLYNELMEVKATIRNERKKFNKEYTKAIENLMLIAEDAVFSRNLTYYNNLLFVNFFRIIEVIANYMIEEDIDRSIPGCRMFRFVVDNAPIYEFSTNGPELKKIAEWKKSNLSLPLYQKICNILYKFDVEKPHVYDLVEKRNSFIHPNIIEDNKEVTVSRDDILNVFEIVKGMITHK